jgi:lipoprotein-anchoring transpeptidase ErfK/SrfK
MTAVLARHRYLAVTSVVAIALAGFAAYELVTAPRIAAVTPSSGGYEHAATVRVSVRVPRLDHLRDVMITVDGTPVSSVTRRGDHVTIRTAPLSDGSHTVRFAGTSSNVFSRHVSKTWRFTVDTVAPPLTLTSPAFGRVVTMSPLVVRGETEAGAGVSIACGRATVTTVAAADGRFSVALEARDGRGVLRVQAADVAGNTTDLKTPLTIDATPPDLSVAALPTTVRTNVPRVRILASDPVGPPRVTVRVDGQAVVSRLGGRPTKVHLDRLTDGRHRITVVAVDVGGNVATNEQAILVDTTEKLGEATLTQGARGKDVLELQRKLKKAGFFHGRPNGVLDRATVKAVKRFEAHMAMTPDGVVGTRVVGALSGRIVVDLSDCRLYLYKDGALVSSYSVAVGQPAYPTPTGDYAIESMAMNPSWIPPDSPWAKGLEPIPPGPGNPVGTRWIGTSAPGVGIHGTPADYSIGTHASHGCIRMHMWDVEDLFTRVVVGMPIHIQP